MAPSRVGPFAIEDSLRPDGRGAVFRAIHVDKRKVLALKLFSAPLAGQNTSATEQFYAETARLKALDHIHIARCYGGGFDQNTGYIAFEFIEGESLAELIGRRGRLSWEMAIEFSKQLVSAIEYLHSQRLYHLDLRPEKMVIDNLDQLQLLDCRADRPNNPFRVETPLTDRLAYLAPEQLNGLRQNHKTDLYQVGCLLYHMLTGAPPFPSNTADERLAMQQAGPPPRVSEIIFDCPVWLETIIGQLLAYEPDDRPFGAAATTLALNEATRKMASGAGVAEHAAGGFSSLAKPEDADEAKRLLGKDEQAVEKSKTNAGTPIWERSWFLFGGLSLCLLLICGYIAWIAWPLSNTTMLARADQLMASEDATDWVRAKQDYLEPLLDGRKLPKEIEQRANEHMTTISIYTAERRRVNNRKFNKPPRTEGERLINQALDLAEFGDISAAREKLNSMATLLAGNEEEPYILLAEQKLRELQGKTTSNSDRAILVQAKLDEAEALHKQGKTKAARDIWKSVVQLYEDDESLKGLASQAKERLESSS